MPLYLPSDASGEEAIGPLDFVDSSATTLRDGLFSFAPEPVTYRYYRFNIVQGDCTTAALFDLRWRGRDSGADSPANILNGGGVQINTGVVTPIVSAAGGSSDILIASLAGGSASPGSRFFALEMKFEVLNGEVQIRYSGQGRDVAGLGIFFAGHYISPVVFDGYKLTVSAGLWRDGVLSLTGLRK